MYTTGPFGQEAICDSFCINRDVKRASFERPSQTYFNTTKKVQTLKSSKCYYAINSTKNLFYYGLIKANISENHDQ